MNEQAAKSVALAETAWQQGSLFPAEAEIPLVACAHPDQQAVELAERAVAAQRRERQKKGKDLTGPLPFQRPARRNERTIALSQTCDIIKPSEQLPQVDVGRVFETTNAQIIREAQDFGSARYFRLNPVDAHPALVLDFGWRSQVDKGFLTAYEPDNSIIDGWDEARRRTLARWLGRRYSRPVLSDKDVAEISDPVRQRWRRLVDEEPDVAARCSAEYSEFRYRREADGSLTAFLLSQSADPDETVWLETVDILQDAMRLFHGTVNFSSDQRSYHTFTKAQELATEQIDLMWASHEEGSASGEVPPED